MSAEVDIKQLAIVRGEEPSTKTGRRRHVVSRYLVPGALLLGFGSLVAWASRDAVSPPQDVWVVPVLASQSAVQQAGTPLFQAAGWIEPRPTPIRVAALSPGVVERLLVVQDQQVQAGEPVAELIKTDAQLVCDGALANLQLQEADLKDAKAALTAATTRFNRPVHLEASLGEAEAALAQVTTEQNNLPFEIRRAEAQLAFAEKDFENKQASQGAIAGRNIREAKSALDSARATLEELQNRVASLGKQEQALVRRRDALRAQLELLTNETQDKEQAEAKFEAGTARVAQARVTLEEAKLRLDRMTVRAPVDGRVYQLVAFPGTTLTGGMGPVPNVDGSTVVSLYQPNMLQIRVDARFEDIPKVSLGQPVQINNPALSAPLAGKVLFVSSEANIQKNTLQVKVAIDAPPAVFKPEMLVDVTFLAPQSTEPVAESSEETRLYLPQQLIQRDDAGAFVWLADQSDKVARKLSITVGHSAPRGLLEVSGQGLTIASRVISRGHETLDDGDRIRIVSEDPESLATAAATVPQEAMHRLPHQGE
jgi:multidrug efflux pump subunit AcrA (membrane-fusion protein)